MRLNLTIGAVVLLSGSFAMAQEERGDRGPGGPPGGRGGFSNPLFEALDADSDGTISEKEIEGAVAALKKLDKDANGSISREEVRPQFPQGSFGRGGFGDGRPGGGPGGGTGGSGAFTEESYVQMMMGRDADKNGKLDATELGERSARYLEDHDANGDKTLDQEELKKVYAEIRARFGDGNRGRGDGDRPRPEGDRPRSDSGSGDRPQRPASDDSV